MSHALAVDEQTPVEVNGYLLTVDNDRFRGQGTEWYASPVRMTYAVTAITAPRAVSVCVSNVSHRAAVFLNNIDSHDLDPFGLFVRCVSIIGTRRR